MNEIKKINHPALLFSSKHLEDLRNIPASKDPIIIKGFDKLKKTASLSYTINVIKNIDIGPYGVGVGHKEVTQDSTQCYLHAVMWLITRNDQYATKSLDILMKWSKECLSLKGTNAPLECAWAFPPFTRAAEILKYTWTKWTQQDELVFNAFLDKIALPNLLNRYKEIIKWNNNWILTIIECLIQIALYKNDVSMVHKYASEFIKVMPCCIYENGFSTETKRDQCHLQFQIGSLVQVCEMLWHQGIDLYKLNDNRIRKCMEYHAFILNGGVPTEVKKEDLKDVWFLSCAWEVGYNHYVNRKKMTMPETNKLLTKNGIRPEHVTFNWGPGWLHYNRF
jgi:hypothetical protein